MSQTDEKRLEESSDENADDAAEELHSAEMEETDAEEVHKVKQKENDLEVNNDQTITTPKTSKKQSKKEKKVPMPVRCLSNDEYDEIFDAVLARMEAEVQAEEEEDKRLTLFDNDIKEDDFDAILQESDKDIGKYVDAFLGEGEEVEKFTEDDVITSTPVLEQVLHSSQEESLKSESKKQETRQEKTLQQKKVKVKKHPSSEKQTKEPTVAHRSQDKISKRLSMQKRKIEMKGTWVQCEACDKWRYLADAHDPALLPQKWTCTNSTDEERNTCDAEEEEWDEEEHTDEYVLTKFTEGSVVWARMNGFPWWPAMIEIDPDYGTFCECNVDMERGHGKTNVATHYHVVFFDDKVSRAWVRSSNVHVFTGMEDMGSCKVRGVNYKKQIELAMERALTSLELSLQERIKTCGFAARYSGKWGSSTEGKKEKKLKKKRKKKDGSSIAADTSILQEAEELLKNTETVLDELLSSSESEESTTSLPLKKRKVQSNKKTQENETSVKKPSFGSGKKSASVLGKRQKVDDTDKSGQPKKKVRTDEDEDKPMKKVLKDKDENFSQPKKKDVKEKEDKSEEQKKVPKENNTEKKVPKATCKEKSDKQKLKVPKMNSSEKPTPKKIVKKDKALNDAGSKKENVQKPVFGAPKIKTITKKVTDDKSVDDSEENSHGDVKDKDTNNVKTSCSNMEEKSDTAAGENEKVSPVVPKIKSQADEKPKPAKVQKAKKGFMAPVVKKPVANEEKKDKPEKAREQKKDKLTKKDSTEKKEKATNKDTRSKENTTKKNEEHKKDSEEKEENTTKKNEEHKKGCEEKEENARKESITQSGNKVNSRDNDDMDTEALNECEQEQSMTADSENDVSASQDMKVSIKLRDTITVKSSDPGKKIVPPDTLVAQTADDSDFDFEE